MKEAKWCKKVFFLVNVYLLILGFTFAGMSDEKPFKGTGGEKVRKAESPNETNEMLSHKYKRMGDNYFYREDYEKAREYYKKAYTVKEEYLEAMLGYAEASKKQVEREKSIKRLEKIENEIDEEIKAFIHESPKTDYFIGELYMVKGMIAEKKGMNKEKVDEFYKMALSRYEKILTSDEAKETAKEKEWIEGEKMDFCFFEVRKDMIYLCFDSVRFLGAVGYSTLYAINLGTGSLWKIEKIKGEIASIFDSGDVIYVAGYRGFLEIFGRSTLYAINKNTGEIIWKNEGKIKGEVTESHDSEGIIYVVARRYFGTGKYRLYAINKKTGEVVWRKGVFRGGVKNIWISGDVIYVPIFKGNKGSTLYALKKDDGKVLWINKGEINKEIKNIQFSGDLIYVETLFYDLYIINKHTGKVIWRSEGSETKIINYWLSNRGVYVATKRGISFLYFKDDTGEVIEEEILKSKGKVEKVKVLEETIYVITSEPSHIYGLNRDTGEIIWNSKGKIEGNIRNIEVSEDIIYAITSHPSNFYVIDRKTGKVMWDAKGKIGEEIDYRFTWRNIIYAETHPSFVDNFGNFYALNRKTGEVILKIEGEGIDASEVGDMVYVRTSYPFYLYAIQKNNGRVVWKTEMVISGWFRFYDRGEVIYVRSEENGKVVFYALNRINGEIVWKKRGKWGFPLFTGDVLIVNKVDKKWYVKIFKVFPLIKSEINALDVKYKIGYINFLMGRYDKAMQIADEIIENDEKYVSESFLKEKMCGEKREVYCQVLRLDKMLNFYSAGDEKIKPLYELTGLKMKKKFIIIEKYFYEAPFLYIISNTHRISALNTNSGEIVWSHKEKIEEKVEDIKVSGDKIYVVTSRCLYAFNKYNGKALFKINKKIKESIKKFHFSGDVIYFITSKPSTFTLYAFNINNGKILWKREIIKKEKYMQVEIVQSSGDVIYVRIEDALHALHRDSGKVIWNTEKKIKGKILIIKFLDDIIYITAYDSKNNFIYAINKNDGEVIWKKNTKNFVKKINALGEAIIVHERDNISLIKKNTGETIWNSKEKIKDVIHEIRILGNIIYVRTQHNNHYLIKNNGEIIYKKRGNIENVWFSENEILLLTKNKKYFPSTTLYSINKDTGDVIWSTSLGILGRILGRKCSACKRGKVEVIHLLGDKIYVRTSFPFKIYALNKWNGKVVWKIEEDKNWEATFFLEDGIYGISPSPPILNVINKENGEILWKYPFSSRSGYYHILPANELLILVRTNDVYLFDLKKINALLKENKKWW